VVEFGSVQCRVTVVIVGLSKTHNKDPLIFEANDNGETNSRAVKNINPYLVGYGNVFVSTSTNPIADVPLMINGSKPVDGSNLSLSVSEKRSLLAAAPAAKNFIRPFFGSDEFIKGKSRFCLWVNDEERSFAETLPEIAERFQKVSKMREKSEKPLTRAGAKTPHRFQQVRQTGEEDVIIVPSVSSESREYLETLCCLLYRLGTCRIVAASS
jgi:hypothetical protein